MIVEGPMDALAVTLAGRRPVCRVGAARHLPHRRTSHPARRHGRDPVIATDHDLAGRTAAERDYWLLTPHRLNPHYAHLPEGADPADLYTTHGPHTLTAALDSARPLADLLIDERVTNLPPDQAGVEAVRVLAAQPPEHWDQGSQQISSRLHLPIDRVRQELLGFVQAWNRDPRHAAEQPLHDVNQVRQRLTAAHTRNPNSAPPSPPDPSAVSPDNPTPSNPTVRPAPPSAARAHSHGDDLAATIGRTARQRGPRRPASPGGPPPSCRRPPPARPRQRPTAAQPQPDTVDDQPQPLTADTDKRR